MSIKARLAALSLKIKIIIACTVIAAAGVVTAVIVMNSSKEDTYRVLKVFELSGSAVITREGTGELDAYVGMNLESGDTVSVDEGSTLRISMDGDKYVLLDGGTVLELVAEGTPSDSRTSLSLKKGTILNELTVSLSANSSYKVATPKATMAVRGTSFMVSVEMDEDGSYIIKTNTFNGTVEAILLDANGNPTGKTAMVPADKCVIIRTEPNPETGNPAEVDGKSFFVYEISPGVYVEVPEGDDPVSDIIYELISEVVKKYAIRSNDDGTMVLDGVVLRKLKGESGSASDNTDDVSTESSDTTTALSETEPVTTSASEQESVTSTTASMSVINNSSESTVTSAPANEDGPVVTTAPARDDEPAVTTVPTSETSSKTSATTVPISYDDEPDVTTVPTYDTEESTTTTVTVSETERETTTASPASETASKTTATNMTVPTQYTVTTFTSVTTYVTTSEITWTTRETIPETSVTETTTTTSPTTGTTAPETSDVTSSSTTDNVQKFTVSFMNNNFVVYEEEVEYGQTVKNIPELDEREGYTGRWIYDGNVFTADTPVTDNIIVIAEYVINTYSVVFRDESKVISTKYVKHGGTVTDIPAVPQKTGFTGKWMYNNAEFTERTVITGNTVVTAVYDDEEYTVTYVLSSDNSIVLDKLTGLHYGDVPTSTNLPTALDYDKDDKYDYYLLNWTQPNTAITGNTTIEVPYVDYDSVVEVKITDAGGKISTELYQLGDSVTLPKTATALENYEFVGWGAVTSGGYSEIKEGTTPYTDQTYCDCYTHGLKTYDPGETVTLESGIRLNQSPYNFKFVAVYKAKEDTLNFYDEDGISLLKTTTASYNDYLSEYIPSVTEKPGCTFKWQYKNADGTKTDVEDGQIVTSDMDIYLVYIEIA